MRVEPLGSRPKSWVGNMVPAPSHVRFAYGQVQHDQGQAGVERRHRILLCDQEELATQTDKLVKKKYDPVARKHVEFREAKIK